VIACDRTAAGCAALSLSIAKNKTKKAYSKIVVSIIRGYCVSGWLRLVDQVRIKYIELVTLHDLRRRVVEVVVCLVILVPLEAGVDAVEKARFTRTIFISPQENLKET